MGAVAYRLGLLAGYMVGVRLGYALRCREESAAWGHASRAQVFTAGHWVNQPTFAERNAERLAILAEAHAAGLHTVGRPGCAACERQPSPAERYVDGMCDGLGCRCCGVLQELTRGDHAEYVLSRKPHNCHYGVSHRHVWQNGRCVAADHDV